MSDNNMLALREQQELLNAGGIYSSISNQDQEAALEIYSAVSSAQSLSDHLNEVIDVANIVLQPVEITDNQTGEIRQMIRSILITDKGEAFSASSDGVQTSLKNLFSIVGNPPWNPAIPLKAVQRQGRNGYKFLTLEYSPKAKK